MDERNIKIIKSNYWSKAFSENEGEEGEAERIDAGHSASETAMEVLNKGGTAEEEISKASLS